MSIAIFVKKVRNRFDLKVAYNQIDRFCEVTNKNFKDPKRYHLDYIK